MPEREYTCRACGEPFRTEKTGKGIYYCHRSECDERRLREGIVTRNTEPFRAAAERREARRVAKVMRATHAEALRMDRARDRESEARARRIQALRPKIATARERLETAVEAARSQQETVRRLLSELAELEGRRAPQPPAPIAATAQTAMAPEPRQLPYIPTGDFGELIERTQGDVVRRGLEPSGDRRLGLRKAVVAVAGARGVPAMRMALHVLAVESLAWEYQLRGGGRDIGRAAEEAAA